MPKNKNVGGRPKNPNPRVSVAFRCDPEIHTLLEKLWAKLEGTKTLALETAIREAAESRNLA